MRADSARCDTEKTRRKRAEREEGEGVRVRVRVRRMSVWGMLCEEGVVSFRRGWVTIVKSLGWGRGQTSDRFVWCARARRRRARAGSRVTARARSPLLGVGSAEESASHSARHSAHHARPRSASSRPPQSTASTPNQKFDLCARGVTISIRHCGVQPSPSFSSPPRFEAQTGPSSTCDVTHVVSSSTCGAPARARHHRLARCIGSFARTQ